MWGRRGRAPGVSLTEEDDEAPAEFGAGGCVLVCVLAIRAGCAVGICSAGRCAGDLVLEI